MKKKKPTQKRKAKPKTNPDLPEPIVVDTTHMASKEEQTDNPLNRMKMGLSEVEKRGYAYKPSLELPEGFKSADSMTEVDDLKFEMGRLRELLVSWLDRRKVNGVWYQIMVDPMNRDVQINIE